MSNQTFPMKYVVTLRDGSKQDVDLNAFHYFVTDDLNTRVGATFVSRLGQLEDFTGLTLKDWEMVDA